MLSVLAISCQLGIWASAMGQVGHLPLGKLQLRFYSFADSSMPATIIFAYCIDLLRLSSGSMTCCVIIRHITVLGFWHLFSKPAAQSHTSLLHVSWASCRVCRINLYCWRVAFIAGIWTSHLVGQSGFMFLTGATCSDGSLLSEYDDTILRKIYLKLPQVLQRTPKSLTSCTESRTIAEDKQTALATRFVQCAEQWTHAASGCLPEIMASHRLYIPLMFDALASVVNAGYRNLQCTPDRTRGPGFTISCHRKYCTE